MINTNYVRIKLQGVETQKLIQINSTQFLPLE
jgi:hypothetical protein